MLVPKLRCNVAGQIEVTDIRMMQCPYCVSIWVNFEMLQCALGVVVKLLVNRPIGAGFAGHPGALSAGDSAGAPTPGVTAVQDSHTGRHIKGRGNITRPHRIDQQPAGTTGTDDPEAAPAAESIASRNGLIDENLGRSARIDQ